MTDVLILDENADQGISLPSHSVAAVAQTEVRHPERADFTEADIALAFDPLSLELARAARVPCCIAVLPTFDTKWAGDLGLADGVLVAHDDLIEALPASARGRAVVVGPIAPPQFEPPDDRAKLKAKHSIERATVLIPAELLEDLGATPLLIQLELVSAPVTWLFDVGMDVEAATALRRLLPGHSIDAALFTHGADAAEYWQLADLLLTRAKRRDVSLGLATGAGLVILGSDVDESAAAALEKSGVARIARSLTTLSVELDGAVSVAEELGQAARDLDPTGSAARSLTAAEQQVRDSATRIPRGLPIGLERIRPDRAASDTTAPDASDPAPSSVSDLESQIDDELEALKKRL